MSTTGELVRPHNLDTVEMQTLLHGRRFRSAVTDGHVYVVRSASDTSVAARRRRGLW